MNSAIKKAAIALNVGVILLVTMGYFVMSNTLPRVEDANLISSEVWQGKSVDAKQLREIVLAVDIAAQDLRKKTLQFILLSIACPIGNLALWYLVKVTPENNKRT